MAGVNEETHEPVEDGTEGEIWVSSPSNASGYLGSPSLTREIFHQRLKDRVSKCFVRTGDRGIIKGEKGYLFVTGRCSDIIKLENNEEIHSHYIETAAYNSCPQFLRGGCMAAFEISKMVVLVAETQRVEKDVEVVKRICERVKKCVYKEEKVELGLLVLVKNGSVPKTTSGKVQRWLAKEKLIGGKLNLVMEMRFAFGPNLVGESDMGRGKKECSFSFSNAPTRPSLFSLL